MPTRYESLSVFKLLESLEDGGHPSLLTVSPENAKEFEYPVVFEEQFGRHTTAFNTEKVPESLDFTAEAETFDITPDDKETQKASLAAAYAIGEIDEMTYLHFLNEVDQSEKFEGSLIHTIWKTRYFVSPFPYEREHGLQVPLPLSYRDINDHHEKMKIQQAEVILNGFLIDTSIVHVLRNELSFDTSIVRVTMPYSWRNGDDYSGSGDIEMVFNLDTSTIQVFFKKNWTNGCPLFTTSYTINIRTGLDRIQRDDPGTTFQTPMFNEGNGKPPKFEDTQEFIFSLVELASDYTTRALQLSFALMLTSYSNDI